VTVGPAVTVEHHDETPHPLTWRQKAGCDRPLAPANHESPRNNVRPEAFGQPIAGVEFSDYKCMRLETLRERVQGLVVGAPLTVEAVETALRALDTTNEIDIVEVQAKPSDGGLTVRFYITERPHVH